MFKPHQLQMIGSGVEWAFWHYTNPDADDIREPGYFKVSKMMPGDWLAHGDELLCLQRDGSFRRVNMTTPQVMPAQDVDKKGK